MLVWTSMTTGARHGELCALRWTTVTLDDGREAVWLRRAIQKVPRRRNPRTGPT